MDDKEKESSLAVVHKQFSRTTAYNIVRILVKEILDGETYSEYKVDDWMKKMTSKIHKAITDQKYYRYKIITHIILCPNIVNPENGTIINNASNTTNCLWDSETDKLITYVFSNVSLIFKLQNEA